MGWPDVRMVYEMRYGFKVAALTAEHFWEPAGYATADESTIKMVGPGQEAALRWSETLWFIAGEFPPDAPQGLVEVPELRTPGYMLGGANLP